MRHPDYGHKWSNSYDNERVICLYCECSPLSSTAKEPCPDVPKLYRKVIQDVWTGEKLRS